MNSPEALYPATRDAALARLRAFLPRRSGYGALRNRVVSGHPDVTPLSAAGRARLGTTEQWGGPVAVTPRCAAGA